jgi:hypothetical protein
MGSAAFVIPTRPVREALASGDVRGRLALAIQRALPRRDAPAERLPGANGAIPKPCSAKDL